MSTEKNKVDNDVTIDDSSPGNMDVDEEKDDNLRVKNTNDVLAKASMTESYSEILNSPTMETNEKPIESSAPIVIQKRRPSSLTRHHSSQCKFELMNSFIHKHQFHPIVFFLFTFAFCSFISTWISSS